MATTAPHVTDATACPPLELPDTVTVTAALYEYLSARNVAFDRADRLLVDYMFTGRIATGADWREYLDARAKVDEALDVLCSRPVVTE